MCIPYQSLHGFIIIILVILLQWTMKPAFHFKNPSPVLQMATCRTAGMWNGNMWNNYWNWAQDEEIRVEKEEEQSWRKKVGGKEREGEEKLAMLPNCTWVVQISSGTIFLCNTSNHNVAKRHDTAWHHHTTLSAQHRPLSHIYVCLCVCVDHVWCVYCRYWGCWGVTLSCWTAPTLNNELIDTKLPHVSAVD